ncbi:Methyl-accepting chemotaxis protein PctB [Thalassocella blandensis]|nr:Methyl-accepting chemotaxis protein PctB [Thalassocella blandensis]
MAWFNDLSFNWKLRIPLVGIALLMGLLVAFGLVIHARTSHLNELINEHYFPSTEFLLEADRDLYQALLAERQLVMSQGQNIALDRASMVNEIRENLGQARTRVGKYASHMEDAELLALVDQFYRTFDQRSKEVDTILQLIQSDPEAAIEMSLGRTGEEFEEMREYIDTLTEKTHIKSVKIREQIKELEGRGLWQLSLLLGLGLLFCLALGIILPSFITSRIKSLLVRLQEIVHGEGDLTRRLHVSGQDEFGKIATEFNHFMDKLHESIKEIADVSGDLKDRADFVQNHSEENIHITDKQHSETNMAATAIHEISQTVSEVASNTAHAADAAKLAAENASKGSRLVDTVSGEIELLASEIDASSNAINELKEDSNNVGSVLDVIRGIAEQTNLLALNAAIEAARAGEQGRGFAVVADEVRTLAQRTQESTQEIRELIEKLQAASELSVQRMNRNREQVLNTVSQAKQAGEALKSINEMVQNIVGLNIQIATASEEQTSVTEEIGRNMANIAQQTDMTAMSAKTLGVAAQELMRLSQSLNHSIEGFRV